MRLISLSYTITLLALSAFVVEPVVCGVRDVLLAGEYHGAYFGGEHGWVLVRAEFPQGRTAMSLRIAASSVHYNNTCDHEQYRLGGFIDNLNSIEASQSVKAPAGLIGNARKKGAPAPRDDVVGYEVEMPNVATRRGCMGNRIRTGDFKSVTIAAAVHEDSLRLAAAATRGVERTVRPEWLRVTVSGLGEPLPATVTLELHPSEHVERSVDHLARHFPPHARHRGKGQQREEGDERIPKTPVDEL